MPNIDFQPIIDHMDKVPDDKFPKMLFEPMINQFDDAIGQSYFAEYDESDELIDKAMSIGGVIKDYGKYLDELDIYNEYMQALAEKYGSIEIVENAAKAGTIADFVPRMPVLKKTKRNKILVRSGTVPSRIMFEPDYSTIYSSAISRLNDNWKNINEDKMFEKPDKATAKALKRYSNKLMIQDRLRVYSGNSSASILKQISEIYASLSDGGYRKDNGYGFISLTDLKKERKKLEETPDQFLEAEFDQYGNGKFIMMNGRFIDNEKRLRMQIIQDLIAAGFDPLKIGAKNGISKKEIKIVVSQMASSDIPENIKNGKMWKKLSKKKKKAKKRLEESITQNPEIARVISNSHFSLSDTINSLFND